MSYDLVVFEADGVPRELSDFQAWYSSNLDAAEESGTWLQSPSTSAFTAFYEAMVAEFPDMNGPSGEGVDEAERLAGYEFQPSFISMDFRWSASERALNTVMRLAPQYNLGIYDNLDGLVFPDDQNSATPKLSITGWIRDLFKS